MRSTPISSRQLGDDTRRDRLARRRLLVLARVAVPGHHRDDPVRRRALCRVDHHQQLHQRVVRSHSGGLVGGRGLDEEDVGAADRLLVAAVDLAVGERAQVDCAEVDVELAGDLRGQRAGSAAAEHHQPLRVLLRYVGEELRSLLDRAHVLVSPGLASSASCLFASSARFLGVTLDVLLIRAG